MDVTHPFYKTPSQKVGVGSLEKEIQVDDNHKIPGKNMRKWCVSLGGGFKDFLFLPLLGEMIQFDEHIFQMGGSTTN